MLELFGPVTPVLVIGMIMALVQLIKTQLNLSGVIVIWLSFGVGIFFGALLLAMEFYPPSIPYIQSFTYLILFGLVAAGFYDLTKRKELTITGSDEPLPFDR